MAFAGAVIDISLDFSKAEALVAKTLTKTIEVESKIASIQAELAVAEDSLNLNDAIMRELEFRTENIDDAIEIHRTKLTLIDEFVTLEQARIEAEEAKLATLNQKVEQVKTEMEIISSTGLANIRRTAAFGTYIFQALGAGVGQTLTLLAETISLTIETAQAINALDIANIAKGGPITAAVTLGSIGLRLALIGSLLFLTMQIATQKQKVSQEFQSVVGAMRILTI